MQENGCMQALSWNDGGVKKKSGRGKAINCPVNVSGWEVSDKAICLSRLCSSRFFVKKKPSRGCVLYSDIEHDKNENYDCAKIRYAIMYFEYCMPYFCEINADLTPKFSDNSSSTVSSGMEIEDHFKPGPGIKQHNQLSPPLVLWKDTIGRKHLANDHLTLLFSFSSR